MRLVDRVERLERVEVAKEVHYVTVRTGVRRPDGTDTVELMIGPSDAPSRSN